jgi:hypothetical protein
MWRRLGGVLVHFALSVNVDRSVFGAMVGFIAVVHVVQRSWRVWSLASPMTSVRGCPLLVALGRPLVESFRV